MVSLMICHAPTWIPLAVGLATRPLALGPEPSGTSAAGCGGWDHPDPVSATGAPRWSGLLAWTLLQRRLRPCPACGFRSLATEQSEQCPACGTVFELVVDGTPQAAPVSQPGKSDRFGQPMENFDARDVTIDVQATELDE